MRLPLKIALAATIMAASLTPLRAGYVSVDGPAPNCQAPICQFTMDSTLCSSFYRDNCDFAIQGYSQCDGTTSWDTWNNFTVNFELVLEDSTNVECDIGYGGCNSTPSRALAAEVEGAGSYPSVLDEAWDWDFDPWGRPFPVYGIQHHVTGFMNARGQLEAEYQGRMGSGYAEATLEDINTGFFMEETSEFHDDRRCSHNPWMD